MEDFPCMFTRAVFLTAAILNQWCNYKLKYRLFTEHVINTRPGGRKSTPVTYFLSRGHITGPPLKDTFFLYKKIRIHPGKSKLGPTFLKLNYFYFLYILSLFIAENGDVEIFWTVQSLQILINNKIKIKKTTERMKLVPCGRLCQNKQCLLLSPSVGISREIQEDWISC